MCVGENGFDTLLGPEQTFLRQSASARMPTYGTQVRTNDDAMTWVVLEPADVATMPRFTICRITPSIMVMVEDASSRRRFISMATVEDAITFACGTMQEAMLARHNVHEAPTTTQ